MLKELLCVLVLNGVLFQVNEAAPSAIVIAQYTPKIAALAIKIANTVKYGYRAIENGENLIHTLVDFSQNTVNKELDELNVLIEKKEADAKKDNKDIIPCVTKEKNDVQKIDVKTLDECRDVSSIENLKVNLTQMTQEEISLTVAVNICIIKNPILGSKLKVCFDEKINNVENKITQFNSAIYDTIQNAQQESFKCINRDIKALDGEIENVSTEFKTCTDATAF